MLEPAAPSSRDKILDVAEDRFARRGYAGVGLREVAEAAGLGKSSLFHHFRSKAELYLAVLDRVLTHIDLRTAPLLEGAGPVLERFDGAIDALVDALAEQPTAGRLLLRALFEDDDLPDDAEPVRAVEHHVERLIGRLRDLLERGVEQGVFRPVSAAHAIQTIIGATVFHFASGEFGEGLLGEPIFSAEAVRRRKHEIRSLLHQGLRSTAQPA